MELSAPLTPAGSLDLGMALVRASRAPLVLLDAEMRIAAVSLSFCRAFDLTSDHIAGTELFALGDGEWDLAALRALLLEALAGREADDVAIDLVRPARDPCRLLVHAQLLDATPPPRLVLSIVDVTVARAAQRRLEALVREKDVLHQELQHRVANSLQIIASILMQSARRVATDETRTHLVDAHHRVIAIATLQRQLATTAAHEVIVRPYLRELCASIAAAMIYDTKKLSLSASGDDSVTSADLSVSLGLIVTELAINAVKHAFPGDDPTGTIKIDYRAKGAHWVLTVSDDGVGMPPDTATKPGLGTSIVSALADKLGASVVVSPANPGTCVTVTHA
jgi:two-component sensor histidine kinase